MVVTKIEWGTASSLFHKELYAKLIWHYPHQIELENPHEWDDEGMMFSQIHSPHLSAGYHGQMDIIAEGPFLRFKRDADV